MICLNFSHDNQSIHVVIQVHVHKATLHFPTYIRVKQKSNIIPASDPNRRFGISLDGHLLGPLRFSSLGLLGLLHLLGLPGCWFARTSWILKYEFITIRTSWTFATVRTSSGLTAVMTSLPCSAIWTPWTFTTVKTYWTVTPVRNSWLLHLLRVLGFAKQQLHDNNCKHPANQQL